MAPALALFLLLAAEEPPTRPRLFVQALSAQGVEPELARGLTAAVVDALSVRGLYDVVSTNDLETLLGADRQKQLLGVCESDPTACGQGVADAITARFILSGSLSKLGTAYQLSLQMVDSKIGQPVARSLRLSDDLAKLTALVPYAAAEATGSPLPPPPSRILPLVLIGTGSAGFLAGAVLGMLALSRQAVVNDELCPTGVDPLRRCAGVSLRPREYYLQQDADIAHQKTAALILLLAGATVGIAGILLWPNTDTQGVRVSLVPSLSGFSVVGAF